MSYVRLATAGLLLILAGYIAADETVLGVCDAAALREKLTLQYNIESRKDTNTEFRAKEACTDHVVIVQRCAVINIQNKKTQRYCFSEDRPTYYEYFDVIEYWGIPTN